MSPSIDTRAYYWPDGIWCYASEYSEAIFRYKGDDFGILDVSDCKNEAEVDNKVDAIFFMKALPATFQEVP